MIITFNKSILIYPLFPKMSQLQRSRPKKDARQFHVQGLQRLQDIILC